jgi:uncharacterized membrane protein YgdD (TMEM256/DUF423 family)
MNRKFVVIAGVLGALAVGLGAFGAHSLKSLLSAYQLGIFKTGIQYHFYHTFAILCLAILGQFSTYKSLQKACWFFTFGIVLFSGSLYLLATKDILGLNSFTLILGPLTPIGGVLFLIGWGLIISTGLQLKKPNAD